MEEKPNYYAIIPANVRYDKNLKDKAKLLYGEITALSNKDGYCYASNKYFAKIYNVSTTTISLLIKNLIDNGYVKSEIIYKEGTKEILNRYLKIVNDPYLKNFNDPYLKKIKYPIKEKLKDNNTSINNTRSNNTSINNIHIQNDTIPYEEIINYLNLKANKNFRHNIKKTRSLIQARFNEGFNLNDFKIVIDKKCDEWINTEYEKYLRPETLFSNKFEGYLNQKENKKEMSKSARQLKIMEGLADGTINII